MQFKTRERLSPDMNITPLIDAVLLLLIFFMVSSSFVVQPGIKVELPESESGDVQARDEIRIALNADGVVFFDNRQMTLGQLTEALATLQGSINKRETAIIQADKRVPHGTVVSVMDIVQSAGLKLAIGTTTEPAP